jgi:hypothetical protein
MCDIFDKKGQYLGLFHPLSGDTRRSGVYTAGLRD